MIQAVKHKFYESALSLLGIGSFQYGVPPYKIGLRAIIQLPYYGYDTSCHYVNGSQQPEIIVAKPDDTRFSDVPIGTPMLIDGHQYNGSAYLTTGGTDLNKVKAYRDGLGKMTGFFFPNACSPPVNNGLPTSVEGFNTSWGYYLIDANDDIINSTSTNPIMYERDFYLSKDNTFLYGSFSDVKLDLVTGTQFSLPALTRRLLNVRMMKAILGLGVKPSNYQLSTTVYTGRNSFVPAIQEYTKLTTVTPATSVLSDDCNCNLNFGILGKCIKIRLSNYPTYPPGYFYAFHQCPQGCATILHTDHIAVGVYSSVGDCSDHDEYTYENTITYFH